MITIHVNANERRAADITDVIHITVMTFKGDLAADVAQMIFVCIHEERDLVPACIADVVAVFVAVRARDNKIAAGIASAVLIGVRRALCTAHSGLNHDREEVAGHSRESVDGAPSVVDLGAVRPDP